MAIQIRRTATPNNPPTGLLPGQLSVEMANDPPTLWVGVPPTIDSTGRRQIVGGGTRMGVTDGKWAAPGEIGELRVASQYKNDEPANFDLTLALTAGDWDITILAQFNGIGPCHGILMPNVPYSGIDGGGYTAANSFAMGVYNATSQASSGSFSRTISANMPVASTLNVTASIKNIATPAQIINSYGYSHLQVRARRMR